MIKYLLFTVSGLWIASECYSQNANARQFDFWVGEWNIDQEIRDTDSSWLHYKATTKVQHILDQQALVEQWRGEVKFFWYNMENSQSINGYSLRYYDEPARAWRIYWMDSLNPTVTPPFTGNFSSPGHGEFYRTTTTDGHTTFAKITFDRQDHDHVEWTLAVSKDNTNWNVLWVMHMSRK